MHYDLTIKTPLKTPLLQTWLPYDGPLYGEWPIMGWCLEEQVTGRMSLKDASCP